MTIQLSTLIHQIRAAQSIDEEEHLITTELANIRTYIRECDSEMRPRIIAKLVYLNMIGRSTTFGQMECLNLMSDERFSFKRIGYLGSSLLLDETAEVTVLLTHTLEKDLQSKHRFVVALALALLANIGSTELCRSLASDVQKVLEIDDPFLRKRAAMAVIRIINKLPDFVETFQPMVHLLLNDTSHSVVLSGVSMVIQMLKSAPQLSASWSRFTPAFVKILRSLISSMRSSDEASDPFLQVKVLEILALLRSPSDELDEVLASIVSVADMKRSDGRAVLLQAVQTIVAVGKKPSLRTLAFNQIGRLLSFREVPNVLYSALNVFSRVLYANRDILDRSGSDALALQRYKAQIVRCLDNPDISIRRRALDVISALIDQDNAERLVPEILKYLHLADAEFRMELVGRIFASIQRFSPNEQWNFDAILQILKESGGYVRNDIISAVCGVVSRSESMQTYAVNKIINQNELAESSTVQPLVQVAAWILGEYGEQSDTLEETFSKILVLPQTTKETKGYILTAMAKLSSRSNQQQMNQNVLQSLTSETKDSDLDLQQRAGEFFQILTKTTNGESILAPAPPVEEDFNDDLTRKQTSSTNAAPSTEEGNLIQISTEQKQQQGLDNWMTSGGPTNTQSNQQPQGDLLDDLLGDIVGPSSATTTNSQQQSNSRTSLNDLLDEIDTKPNPNSIQPQPVQQSAPQQKAPQNLPPGAKLVYNSTGIMIYLEVNKANGNPNMVALRTSFFNFSTVKASSISIKFQAPEGWASNYQPPTGDTVEPNGKPVLQISQWLNNGMKIASGAKYNPMALKMNVSYYFGTMPTKEFVEIPQSFFQ